MAAPRRSMLTNETNSPSPNDPGRDLFEACRSGDLNKVKKLVTAQNVNSRDTAGRKSTPLHFAAGFGRKDVVEHLLEIGANPQAQDDGGLIPLHNACSFGHAEVVQLLLRHGAEANMSVLCYYNMELILTYATLMGKTPLDLADQLAKAVLTGEYKKDEILEASRSGNEEKMMALLTPLNVNCHASDGRNLQFVQIFFQSTPLHLAAGYNRTRIVQILIEHGSDVHAKDKGGLVPLHNAVPMGILK
ncbi:hypothetical protein ScPMuIL_000877 [Solemya velum]